MTIPVLAYKVCEVVRYTVAGWLLGSQAFEPNSITWHLLAKLFEAAVREAQFDAFSAQTNAPIVSALFIWLIGALSRHSRHKAHHGRLPTCPVQRRVLVGLRLPGSDISYDSLSSVDVFVRASYWGHAMIVTFRWRKRKSLSCIVLWYQLPESVDEHRCERNLQACQRVCYQRKRSFGHALEVRNGSSTMHESPSSVANH